MVATLGLLVNIAAFALLHGGDKDNLNIRGAAMHVLGDLLGSAAAILAAIVILTTGWMPIDPILSVLVALIILRAATSIVRKSGHILLEGTPEHVDPGDLRRQLVDQVPQVSDIHHVHIWSLTGGKAVLTLHAVLADGADHDQVLSDLHRALERGFGISHATIQLERGLCPDDVKEATA